MAHFILPNVEVAYMRCRLLRFRRLFRRFLSRFARLIYRTIMVSIIVRATVVTTRLIRRSGSARLAGRTIVVSVSAVGRLALLWSSIFVTLVAKKIS